MTIEILARSALEVPLDPDGETARAWLVEELQSPEYAASMPTPLDVIAQRVWDWFLRLLNPDASGLASWVPLIIVAILIAVIVAAVVIWGRPKRNRRDARNSGELFGESDARTAAQIRAAANRAAAAGDFNEAIVEGFRALARGLEERTVLELSPGSTAHQAATRAALSFPDAASRLELAARDFDDIRYLSGSANLARWERLRDLDREIDSTSPVLQPIGVVPR